MKIKTHWYGRALATFDKNDTFAKDSAKDMGLHIYDKHGETITVEGNAKQIRAFVQWCEV
jgi:hypothetical protein